MTETSKPANSYSDFDRERFLDEPREKFNRRSEFARDRARVLHSSALRRLGAKTQVLEAGTDEFSRTRLTHSLEVAQVGREMASDLGLDPDLVDMACLAHDLGHPPFGHNGEKALNDWAKDFGGFEGNAQTLRLITRLEPKVFSDRALGLNLTRASLDATCKYPWALESASQEPSGERVSKFGFYEDDREIFEWMRQDAPFGQKCIEAQVMDFADDVAYSVHDFEDAIVSGFIPLSEINRAVSDSTLNEVIVWAGEQQSKDSVEAALERVRNDEKWVADFDGSERSRAHLKNLASSLIGSFVSRTTAATLVQGNGSLARYQGSVAVPDDVAAEIALLKGLVSAYLMSHESRRPYYERQRQLLSELADALLAANGQHLDSQCSAAWLAARSDEQKHRVIVDQIALLTDQGALALHDKLVIAGA